MVLRSDATSCCETENIGSRHVVEGLRSERLFLLR